MVATTAADTVHPNQTCSTYQKTANVSSDFRADILTAYGLTMSHSLAGRSAMRGGNK